MASKVILKNTTKLSLNERFTAYRQQAEAEALRAAAAAAAVPHIPPVPQASMRNVRLAQQMANRPSVLAALRLRKAPPVLSGGYMVPSPSIGAMEHGVSPLGGGWVLQRSLRQRLGPLSGGVKARLGLRPFHPAGMLLRSRLGLRPLQANGTRAAPSRRKIGITQSGTSLREVHVDTSSTSTRHRDPQQLYSRESSRATHIAPETLNCMHQSHAQTCHKQGVSTNDRGAARAYCRQPRANGALRGQFGRPRNRRRRAQQQQQQAAASVNSGGQNDRRQLDQQLEAYMARTRSHLDAELDAYMAQASGSSS